MFIRGVRVVFREDMIFVNAYDIDDTVFVKKGVVVAITDPSPYDDSAIGIIYNPNDNNPPFVIGNNITRKDIKEIIIRAPLAPSLHGVSSIRDYHNSGPFVTPGKKIPDILWNDEIQKLCEAA